MPVASLITNGSIWRRLVRALGKGERRAQYFESVDDLFLAALEIVRAGDVLATMSSGSFERLPNRLLESLEARNA